MQPAAPATMRTVLVATYPNEMEARLLSDRLREEDIPSLVKPMGAGYAFGGTFPFVSHSVYVLESNLEQAKEIAGAGANE